MSFDQESKEIAELFENPHITLSDVLSIPNVCAKFRARNQYITDYFQQEENIKDLFDLMWESNLRAEQKAYLALFQTANISIHETIKESIPLTDYIVSFLDRPRNGSADFFYGLCARILTRAFSLWPEDMTDICRLSRYIYHTIFKNLDSFCIFQAVLELVTNSHTGMSYFLWRLFLFLNKNDIDAYPTPRLFPHRTFPPIEFEITATHIKHAFSLIEKGIATDQMIVPEFKTQLYSYFLKQTTLLPSQMRIICKLNATPEMAMRIMREPSLTNRAHALPYLFSLPSVDLGLSLLGEIISTPQSSNILMNMCLNIIQHHRSQCMPLVPVISHIWNTMDHLESDNLVPYIIEICRLLIDNDEFTKKVVAPWDLNEDVDFGFRFPES